MLLVGVTGYEGWHIIGTLVLDGLLRPVTPGDLGAQRTSCRITVIVVFNGNFRVGAGATGLARLLKDALRGPPAACGQHDAGDQARDHHNGGGGARAVPGGQCPAAGAA